MSNLVFLIISGDGGRADLIADMIRGEFPRAKVFYASEGSTGASKAENVPPSVVFLEWELAKMSGQMVAQQILLDKRLAKTSLIFLTPPGPENPFADEAQKGRVFYLQDAWDATTLKPLLAKALTWSANQGGKEFVHKRIEKGAILIQEGDKAQSVYVLKVGRMQAFKNEGGAKTILGQIVPGEFVGEMAFLNGGIRSASVEALEDCDLIEIPFRTFGHFLKQSPNWAKSLMATLGRRLKPGELLKRFGNAPKP